MKEIIIAPSILNANFMELRLELESLNKNNIKWIHYDVMDGHFVPNLSFGPEILSQITTNFGFKIDVHLMVSVEGDLQSYLKPFIDAGVAQITMHFEALTPTQIQEFLSICKKAKIIPSIALKPATNVTVLEQYLSQLGNILIMSVEPGFGGQHFMDSMVIKVKELDHLRREKKYNYLIEIDGGINDVTVHQLDESGVDMIVAGSYLLGKQDIKARIEKIMYVK